MASTDLLLLQEVEVMYIIPTIRRYLAVYMKELGKSQKQTAELLSLRESTVSQYINEKRGCKIILSNDVLMLIKESAGNIVNKFDTIKHMQKILRIIRKTQEICKIHKQVAEMPEHCNPIELGCVYNDDLHEVRI